MTSLAAHLHPTPPVDHSSEMVSWFIKEAKAPIKVVERRIGSHQYFLCISGFWRKGSFVPVCGRGLTKFDAATRCIGEYLEREAVFDFFQKTLHVTDANDLSIDGSGNIEISKESKKTSLLPMEFWTTNGWAVHTDLGKAIKSAIDEALERHLLIASFLRWGWKGFIEIGQLEIDDLQFRSCISRFRTKSFSAGFAIGTRNGADGASFGHFCDRSENIKQSPKWTQGLYESADKLTHDFDVSQSKNPIAIDSDWYLKNQIAMNTSTASVTQEELNFGSASIVTQDISAALNLPFPLYSAYVFGGDLLPLFLPRTISNEGIGYLKSKTTALGFDFSLPDRMPVL